MNGSRLAIVMGFLICAPGISLAEPPPDSPVAHREAEHLNELPPVKAVPTGHVDATGRKQQGRASFYGKEFDHKTMADGRKMNPAADVAASRTLPLGSVAKVTNLENGKTTTVRIEDRGPYVGGRIIDLTPKAASQLDMTKKGVAPVQVKPITLPAPDGGVKLGAGAADTPPQQIKDDVETTERLETPAEKVERSR